MKHIGFTSVGIKTWGETLPFGPIKLYIPEPGVRENIDADRWEHIGWVIPYHDGIPNGGAIYSDHVKAGEHGQPAYIERAEPVPMFRDTPPDHMDVRRSEFNALKKDLGDLAKVVVELTRRPEPTPAAPIHPGRPNNKHGIPTGQLLSEVIEFCDTELDSYADLDGDSEINCTRANVYLRELVRRMPAEAPAPMTFYDHAFIAAWSELKRDYPEMQWLNRIERAHDIAGRLTFHRSPKT